MNFNRLNIHQTIGLFIILFGVSPFTSFASSAIFNRNEFNAIHHILKENVSNSSVNNKKNNTLLQKAQQIVSTPINHSISYSTSQSSSHYYKKDYSQYYTDSNRHNNKKKRINFATQVTPRHQKNRINHYQYNSTWRQLFGGFQLANYNHHYLVRKFIRKLSNPTILQRLAERSKTHLPMIVKEVRKRRMPAEIAMLPFVESGFKVSAYSHAKAAGLWQFIPATGKQYGLKQSRSYDARYDPIAATQAALNYLTHLNKKFDDWFLALAAYNCGEYRVAKEIAANKKKGLPTDFWNLSLPQETRNYIPKLLAYKELFKAPHRFGFRLPYLPAESHFVTLTINKRLKLKDIEKKAGLPPSTLTHLNRNYKNGITQPRYSKRLLVPKNKVKRIHQVLASLRFNQTFVARHKSKTKKYRRHHKVKRGETLYRIAKTYRTTIKRLMLLNRMRSTRIKVGTRIRIA